MKNFVKILLAAFAIIGSVLGAGFMSGTEIYAFFARFGWVGYVTIAVNCIVFSVYVLICGLKTAKNVGFEQQNIQKNKIFYFCQLLVTATMMSGLVTVLQSFGVAKLWAGPAAFLFLFLCLLFGIRSANFFNVVVALIACFSFLFVAYDSTWVPLGESEQIVFPFFIMLFYVVMNIASSEMVVSNVCKNKKQIVLVSLFLGVILFALFMLLVGFVDSTEMPLLGKISNKAFQKFYAIIMMLAMISTMLSSGVGAKRLFNFGTILSSLFAALLSWLVSFVGFKNLVSYVYPAIGVLIIVSYIISRIMEFREQKAAIL